MPDLQHIDTRVQNDPAWAATRDANLPTAQNWARKVSIVHVLGTDPLAFWNQPWPLTLHPTENTNSRTAQSEDAFGLGRSLYFYAGRAYPRTGGTAFAFGPGSEQGHTGSATPFDTGGLYADAPYAPPISMSPPDNLQRRISLCAASIIPLKDWRPAFAAFLAAYFAPPLQYWRGKPCRPDPDGIFLDSHNTWQAWTFEVRFLELHEITDAEFWCAKEDHVEMFYRHAIEAVPAANAADLGRFADVRLAPQGAMNYPELVEQEIMNRLSQ